MIKIDLSVYDGGSNEGVRNIDLSLLILFAVCFLSNVLGGAVSTLMAVYLPEVVNDLGNGNHLIKSEMGAYINALYLLGWTLGGFAWGLISDRFERLRSFLISFALFGLFTLLISVSSSWESIVILRLFAGFCVGGVLVITNTLLTEIWPENTRAIFIGFLSIGFPIGIISAGLTNYFFFDWETGFFVMGLIPLTLAIISILLLKVNERDKIIQNESLELSLKKVFNDNHENLLKGSVIFGSMLIGMWAVFSWLPTWVQSLLTQSDGQDQRSIVMMLLGLGGLTGGFFSGWIARGMGLRKAMILCFVGCMLTAVIMFGFNRSFSDIIYFETALLAVFFGISQGLLATYVPQLFASSLRGTATGFCYNTGRVFTTVAVFFVGALVTTFGGYSNTLLIFSAVFLLGLITMYFSSDLKLNTQI